MGETDHLSFDDPGSQFEVVASIPTAQAAAAGPADLALIPDGTIVVLDSVKYVLMASSIVQASEGGDGAITKMNLTLERPDSLAAAIDA